MNDSTFSIGPIMKAARKFKKFNQADVARAIGCSQSALSKMEHNLLVPSAPQWFLFSRFTAIPPETLESGIIDRHTLVKFNSDEVSLGFKIPKKYRSHRSQKARELYPFQQYLAKRGPEAVSEYISFTGIDSEFFLDFDNLINFQLLADTIQYFNRKGYNRPADILEIVQLGQNDIYWNHWGVEWKKLRDVKDVLTEYINEQIFFQTDFQLRVDQNDNQPVICYVPEYHLKQFKDLNDDLVNFLNTYRKYSLENLILRVLGTAVTAEIQTDQKWSDLSAKYLIRI